MIDMGQAIAAIDRRGSSAIPFAGKCERAIRNSADFLGERGIERERRAVRIYHKLRARRISRAMNGSF